MDLPNVRNKLIILTFTFFAAITAAFADPAPRPMPWIEKGREFYTSIQARMWGPDVLTDPQPWTGVYVRVNVTDPYPSPALQPLTWYEVDLRPLGVGCEPGSNPCEFIGADYGFFSGVEIITGGKYQSVNSIGQSVYPEVHVTFASYDDVTADCSKYIGQTLDPLQIGGGSRSNMSTLIPMKDAKFKFCFSVSTVGIWDNAPAYGINLSIQSWGIKKP